MLSPVGGNLFAGLTDTLAEEQTMALLATRPVRIERIVSTGQASPPGYWYEQDGTEWVILLRGSAAILFEGESTPRLLAPGDYLHIPAHARHRVERTAPDQPTVWLAIHSRED